MLRDFRTFARLIAAQFAFLSTHELFRMDVEGQFLWDTYLDAFPPGTNPIYRVRTEHDGSYDRNFIRRFGNIAAVIDGKIVTLWDIQTDDEAYREVCAVMAKTVRDAPFRSVFREWEEKLGRVSSTERMDSGTVHTWHHFYADMTRKHLVPRGKVDEVVGDLTTKLGVFTRGIIELEPYALNTVLDLIDQGTLYRGAEFKERLIKFNALMTKYDSLPPAPARDREIWLAHTFATQPWDITLIRNSVIGTLLVELTEGKDVEAAVKAYEQKVAPANYKRPTAKVTQRMIDDASATVESLGLTASLQRRYATLRDINVNNVLWANRAAQVNMKEGLSALVTPTAPVGKHASDKAIDISIDEFIEKILPETTGIEILLSNRLRRNLVSITTAELADAPSLFKWGTPFGWSYNGNVTDSIIEKVKAAGGNTDAKLRFSLAWFNYDDLDLHVYEPRYGHVYYGNKMDVLDVDMNAGGGRKGHGTREPVENLQWSNPADGAYRVLVNQYCKCESVDVGFEIQIAANGNVDQYSYAKAVTSTIEIATFNVVKGEVRELKINPELQGGSISQPEWGLMTETYVKVDTLMLSPNHWDGIASGNKHWFFLINGCRNDEPTRGIYNEFLAAGLEKHRKVFELLGNKTKVPPADEQLSGLGFSSTVRNTVTVRLEHKRGRPLYNIHF